MRMIRTYFLIGPEGGSILRPARPVDVAEVALRVEAVAHPLLEHLGVGEPAVGRAVPDQAVAVMDPEHPPGARRQWHRAEIGAEGGQQFLRHPGGAQQPLALGAIGNGDMGKLRFIHDVLRARPAGAARGRPRRQYAGTPAWRTTALVRQRSNRCGFAIQCEAGAHSPSASCLPLLTAGGPGRGPRPSSPTATGRPAPPPGPRYVW